MNCNIETQVVFCCLCCRKIQRLCKARAEAKFTWIMPSRRQRCIYMNFLLSSRVFYTPAAQKDNCKLSKSCLGCRHMFQL